MATSDAPVSIGRVALVVKDLATSADFYEKIIGLSSIHRDGDMVVLGAGSAPFIELRQDNAAKHSPHEAGLFHTAFLLPSRRDLGAWMCHAVDLGVHLDGASDHLVSEALYLTDPEGNGIEMYYDRPRDEWMRDGEQIRMDTRRLDLDALASAPRQPWKGVPDGSVIGHVHLQVGDITDAESFMTKTLGLVRTFHLPSASWFGSGGYHHHLAVNVWNSRGVGMRSGNSTGLAEIELLDSSGTLPSGNLIDPWGNHFKISKAQSRAA